jgi:hypothetical protein
MAPETETRLREYLEAHHVRWIEASRADRVLGLLRINTPDSLKAAEELVGRAITRCPAAIPTWPPLPVQRVPKRTVVAVGENPCLPGSDGFGYFGQLRVGMTEDQLIQRGIPQRWIRIWTRGGHVTIEEKMR